MKIKPTFIAILTLLSIFLLFNIATAQESNLIVNGGFEQWKDRPETNEIIPAGWWPLRTEYEEMSRVSDMKVSGEYGLKMVTSVRRGRYLIQSDPFKVIPGETYIISCWAYIEKGAVGLSMLNNTANSWATSTKRYLENESFQYYKFTLVAPSNAQELRIIFTSENETGMQSIFYIDDVKVTKVPKPEDIMAPDAIYSYPNLFSDGEEVRFSYFLEEQGEACIKIYNEAAEMVYENSAIPNEAGYNEFAWDGYDNSGAPLKSGIYSCIVVVNREVGLATVLKGVIVRK